MISFLSIIFKIYLIKSLIQLYFLGLYTSDNYVILFYVNQYIHIRN